MENIFDEVREERQRQNAKWGEQNHPCLDQTLLNRQGGCTPIRMCQEYDLPSENVAKTSCDRAFEIGRGTYAHIAVEEMTEVVSQFDIYKRRQELVQLTAVCVAWIEKIDREISNGSN